MEAECRARGDGVLIDSRAVTRRRKGADMWLTRSRRVCGMWWIGAAVAVAASGCASRMPDPSALRIRALETLSELAASPDAQTRANVVEAMQLAPERLERVVRAGLADENEGVRSVSAMVVGRRRLVSLLAEAKALLDDDSPHVWTSAVYALARCGEPDERAMGNMVALMLNSESPRLRSFIAVMLGDLGEPSAVGPLTDAILNIPVRADPRQIRLMELQIAEAMFKLGNQKQIEVIRAALYPSQANDLEATALAAQILGEIRDRASVGALIGLTGTVQQNQLMPAEVRLAAAGSLAQLGHPQGSFIAREFSASDDPALRAQAAYVYGRTGQVENLSRLETLLSDPSPPVRVAAAAGILRIVGRPPATVVEGG